MKLEGLGTRLGVCAIRDDLVEYLRAGVYECAAQAFPCGVGCSKLALYPSTCQPWTDWLQDWSEATMKA